MINRKTTKKLDRSITKEDLKSLTVAELDNVAGGAGFAQAKLMVRNDLRNSAVNLGALRVCSGCHGC